MIKKTTLLLIAGLCAGTTSSHAAYVLINGSFEDTSLPFPNGWTPGGTITDPGGAGFANGTADAFMDAGESITQDFSGGVTTATAENYNFQLDFAFRSSSLSTTSDQRFRLRDHNNTGEMISLGFETAATGGGTALSYFNGSSWITAIDAAFSLSTTYYFRVNGYNFDQAGRDYTVGYSTDGINFTTGANITGFHGTTFGADFETVRFESGGSQMRIDAVSIVPEPSAALLGGLGLLALLRRRRS
ncbi:hypothetical protein OKA05_05870 [Luteolibacter arcticus]|uniref:PEP-CTERM protein-sorting domain-containing protein n=1 Tax=Luteolibacter arcticus TaxID=1581411 RepID=A0ABT3GF38_9BACT|nr:hypothetical protein [Luteolibacter arcticus]MCW1922071.1 hypothetical protein [Luteolibacter arcticus]